MKSHSQWSHLRIGWHGILALAMSIYVLECGASETILDTGPITNASLSTAVAKIRWPAHLIEIGERSVITSVEAFLYQDADSLEPRDLKTVIFSNGVDGLPDERLFVERFTVPSSTGLLTGDPNVDANWHGAFNLNWTLDPGSYWVSFVVDEDNPFVGIMPFQTISNGGPQARWIDLSAPGDPVLPMWDRFDNPEDSIGVRVLGEVIPEPHSAHFLTPCVIVMLHWSRNCPSSRIRLLGV